MTSYSPANSTLSTRIVRSRVNSGRGCRSCNSEQDGGLGAAGPYPGRVAPVEGGSPASPRRTCSPNRRISALCKRDRLSMVSLRQTAIRQTRVGLPR
ncbi:hypothetical protein [Azospirillum melinis]